MLGSFTIRDSSKRIENDVNVNVEENPKNRLFFRLEGKKISDKNFFHLSLHYKNKIQRNMSDSISQIYKDVTSGTVVQPSGTLQELQAIEAKIGTLNLEAQNALTNRLVKTITSLGFHDKTEDGTPLLNLPLKSVILTLKNIVSATPPASTSTTPAPATTAPIFYREPCNSIKTKLDCEMRDGTWRKGRNGKRGNCVSQPHHGGCLPPFTPWYGYPTANVAGSLPSSGSSLSSGTATPIPCAMRPMTQPRLKKCAQYGFNACACNNDPDCVDDKRAGCKGRPYTVSEGLQYQFAQDQYGNRVSVPTGTRRSTWSPATPYE